MRAGLRPHPMKSIEAISEMEYAVLKLLPCDKTSTAKHFEARNKIESIAEIALGSKAFKEKSLDSQNPKI